MSNKTISAVDLAALRAAAAESHEQLKNKPCVGELLTPEEIQESAPFYFALREYIRQLKAARDEAGLTLADVAAKSGLAVESLSRLETGAQTNPTWKTLGMYAKAVGRQPSIVSVALACAAIPPSRNEKTKVA